MGSLWLMCHFTFTLPLRSENELEPHPQDYGRGLGCGVVVSGQLELVLTVNVLRPIYIVQYLLMIVKGNFYWVCSFTLHHGIIVYKFHDIKLPVATIVIGFQTMFQMPTTFFVIQDNCKQIL